MQTTLGCWRDAAACASCRKRLRRSSCLAIDSFITLIATLRSRTESWARYTTPIAPSPTSSMMRYLPIDEMLASAMSGEGVRIGRSRLMGGNIQHAPHYRNHFSRHMLNTLTDGLRLLAA